MQKETADRVSEKIEQSDVQEAAIPDKDDIRGNVTLKKETSNGTKFHGNLLMNLLFLQKKRQTKIMMPFRQEL